MSRQIAPSSSNPAVHEVQVEATTIEQVTVAQPATGEQVEHVGPKKPGLQLEQVLLVSLEHETMPLQLVTIGQSAH